MSRDPNTARAQVLARIRTALDGVGAVPERRGYRTRGQHPAGSAALLDLLADRLVDYRAQVHRTTASEVGATVTAVVHQLLDGLAESAVLVPPGLPPAWTPPGARTDHGQLSPTELDRYALTVTAASAACAETGTIALDGSPDQGRRALTLVPDRHVCVVRAEQVVQTVPELLARLDPRRPLTLVSGPSATSDIELTRVEGVHGPRTLVVVLVLAD